MFSSVSAQSFTWSFEDQQVMAKELNIFSCRKKTFSSLNMNCIKCEDMHTFNISLLMGSDPQGVIPCGRVKLR